ncbi:BN159_2729 family protein [Streptomyces sp. L7]
MLGGGVAQRCPRRTAVEIIYIYMNIEDVGCRRSTPRTTSTGVPIVFAPNNGTSAPDGPEPRTGRPGPRRRPGGVRHPHFEHYHLVYGFLLVRTRNRHLAEDLTQEVFVRALRRIDVFTWQGTAFAAWLTTIAKNLYLDEPRPRLHPAGDPGRGVPGVADVRPQAGVARPARAGGGRGPRDGAYRPAHPQRPAAALCATALPPRTDTAGDGPGDGAERRRGQGADPPGAAQAALDGGGRVNRSLPHAARVIRTVLPTVRTEQAVALAHALDSARLLVDPERSFGVVPSRRPDGGLGPRRASGHRTGAAGHELGRLPAKRARHAARTIERYLDSHPGPHAVRVEGDRVRVLLRIEDLAQWARWCSYFGITVVGERTEPHTLTGEGELDGVRVTVMVLGAPTAPPEPAPGASSVRSGSARSCTTWPCRSATDTGTSGTSRATGPATACL